MVILTANLRKFCKNDQGSLLPVESFLLMVAISGLYCIDPFGLRFPQTPQRLISPVHSIFCSVEFPANDRVATNSISTGTPERRN